MGIVNTNPVREKYGVYFGEMVPDKIGVPPSWGASLYLYLTQQLY